MTIVIKTIIAGHKDKRFILYGQIRLHPTSPFIISHKDKYIGPNMDGFSTRSDLKRVFSCGDADKDTSCGCYG